MNSMDITEGTHTQENITSHLRRTLLLPGEISVVALYDILGLLMSSGKHRKIGRHALI